MVLASQTTLTDKNLYAYCDNNPVVRRDESGAIWETVFDVISLAASIAEVAANPKDVWAWAGLAGDAIDLIPVVTGAGEVVRSLKAVNKIDDISDAVRFSDNTDDVLDVIGGACFVEGTLVLTSKGYVTIENISVGDNVWSQNPETGENGLRKVVKTFKYKTKELVHLHVEGGKITTTPEHPFYVVKNGWVKASYLRAGDILLLQSGEYVVVELIQHEILEAPVTVYNFEVEDFHTYYVGNIGILVHNECILKEAGVEIMSYYPSDHGGPAHLHVIGEGKPTKIGPQGLPVKGYPDLSPKQAKVVANNLPLIKKTIKQKQKILRTMKAR